MHLTGRKGEELPPYYGLAIAGRCGGIDASRRVEVPKQYPGGIFPVRKGLYFDSDSWDGSDIFMPEGRVRWTFVLGEVRSALETARVKNVRFTPLPEVEQSQ